MDGASELVALSEERGGGLALLRGEDRAAAAHLAASSRGRQAGVGALEGECVLALGQGAEEVEHESAAGARGVDVLGERPEPDAAFGERADDLEQVRQRSSEAVQAPDVQRVAGAEKVERGGELGPVGLLARGVLREDPRAADAVQRIELEP